MSAAIPPRAMPHRVVIVGGGGLELAARLGNTLGRLRHPGCA
ncbi:hypothetical protein [Variovorax defluvii]